jgi:hypothetical protein
MKNRLIEMTLLFQLENTALYIQLSWFLRLTPTQDTDVLGLSN